MAAIKPPFAVSQRSQTGLFPCSLSAFQTGSRSSNQRLLQDYVVVLSPSLQFSSLGVLPPVACLLFFRCNGVCHTGSGTSLLTVACVSHCMTVCTALRNAYDLRAEITLCESWGPRLQITACSSPLQLESSARLSRLL